MMLIERLHNAPSAQRGKVGWPEVIALSQNCNAFVTELRQSSPRLGAMVHTPEAAELIVESYAAYPASLRIAVVTETFPPEINGVAMTWGNLVRGLLQLGHAVQLVRPRQAAESVTQHPAELDQLLTCGVSIPNYPALRFGLLSRQRLVQLWRQNRPDIVHVVTEGPLGWCAIAAARKLQLPLTSSFHTNFHHYSKHYGIGILRNPIEAYLRKFHNRTLATLAPTQALANVLQERGFHNVSVLARGVAVEQFSPKLRSSALRAAWGVDDNDVVVLSVGRLAKEKNANRVLAAFAAIRLHLPTAKLVFVGDGPLQKPLQTSCPQALFTGAKTGRELGAHYASSDLFLFPSLTETFGNVIPEALASGLAVVAYAYAAAGQLITHDHNGVLVELDGEQRFVDAALALAIDSNRRNALRQAAPDSIAHLSWPTVTDSLVATLRAALNRHDLRISMPQSLLPSAALQPAQRKSA